MIFHQLDVTPTGRGRPWCVAAVVAMALMGCSAQPPASVTANISPNASADDFPYCGGYGCSEPRHVAFTGDAWRSAIATLPPDPATAEIERDRVATAIAVLERVAGAQAGTARDKGGTIWNLGEAGQLDCFSEAANTTNFLLLLERAGLLRRHRVAPPAIRGFFHGRGGYFTHATAVIEERGSGERFAVDSWFFDNGVPPVVLPLATWLNGWNP